MMPVKIGMNSQTRLTKKPSGSARCARQHERADVGRDAAPRRGARARPRSAGRPAPAPSRGRRGVAAARACARRPPRTAPPAGPRRHRRWSWRRSCPCAACRCSRTGRARPRAAAATSGVATRRRVMPRSPPRSGRRRGGGRPGGSQDHERDREADGDRADDGRHDVAEPLVRSVGEAVAVEQRVAPPAAVVVEALRHRAEAVLRRGRDPPARPRRTHRRARAGRAARAAPSRRGRRRPSATRPGGASSSASVVGTSGVVEAQQRQVGALQVRDDADGERELDEARPPSGARTPSPGSSATGRRARTAACRRRCGRASAGGRTRPPRPGRRRSGRRRRRCRRRHGAARRGERRVRGQHACRRA